MQFIKIAYQIFTQTHLHIVIYESKIYYEIFQSLLSIEVPFRPWLNHDTEISKPIQNVYNLTNETYIP